MDLILNNRPNYFQENNVFEIGFSDFPKVIVKELKIGFQKLKLYIVAYVIINTLIMKSFGQTLKIVPQKNYEML